MNPTLKVLAVASLAAGALTFATPAHATTATACQSYVYDDNKGKNLCGQFPGSDDVNCPQIGKAVIVVYKGQDPWHLDKDGDSKGCDTPSSPSPSASVSVSASASASASTSASPSASTTTTAPTKPTTKPTATRASTTPVPAAAGGGNALPLTGPGSTFLIGGIGVAAVGGGVALALAARRRKTRFTA